MSDPVHRPSIARNEANVRARLAELERSTPLVIAHVDAGGVAWNVANPAWVDADEYPEWTELRVSNTAVGSQVWRAVDDGSVLVWALVVGP